MSTNVPQMPSFTCDDRMLVDWVIQVGPLSSDAMFEVIEVSDACFVHLLLQYASHAIVNQI